MTLGKVINESEQPHPFFLKQYSLYGWTIGKVPSHVLPNNQVCDATFGVQDHMDNLDSFLLVEECHIWKLFGP